MKDSDAEEDIGENNELLTACTYGKEGITGEIVKKDTV